MPRPFSKLFGRKKEQEGEAPPASVPRENGSQGAPQASGSPAKARQRGSKTSAPTANNKVDEKSSGEFKKNKSAESKTAKTSDSKPSDKSAEFKTPVAANTMPGSEKPAENENSSGKGQPQRPTPSPTKIMDGDVYGDPSGQGLADINDILPHDDYQDDEESPHIVLSYESIPVLEQTKLPRGGVSVDTKAVGRVQVRCIIFLIDHMSLCFQHKAALY